MEKWTKYTVQIFLFCLAIVLLWACGEKEELLPRNYVEWVEHPEHGLKIEKKIDPLKFEIQYKPLEYIVAMEERRESISSDLVKHRKSELGEELEYYNFRIAPARGKQNVLMQAARDEQEYYQMIDYFSYAAKDDFYLLQGADTAKCVLYQFVRNYELAPHLEMTMAFENKGQGDKTFVFDDQVMRVGVVKANIEQQKINQLPKLKTK